MPIISQQMYNSRMPININSNLNLGNEDSINIIKSCAVQLKNTMIQNSYPHSIAEVMCNCILMLYEAICNKLNHSHFTEADIDDVILINYYYYFKIIFF